MFDLLRVRDFGLLWLAGLISFAGDFAFLIVLPLHIYRQTDSTLATAGVLMASALPRVLIGSVAGVFVDQWNRKWTMVIADVSRAVLVRIADCARPGGNLCRLLGNRRQRRLGDSGTETQQEGERQQPEYAALAGERMGKRLADRKQCEFQAVDKKRQSEKHRYRAHSEAQRIVQRLLKDEVLEETDHDDDRREVTDTPGDVLPQSAEDLGHRRRDTLKTGWAEVYRIGTNR